MIIPFSFGATIPSLSYDLSLGKKTLVVFSPHYNKVVLVHQVISLDYE
jgi:hypothetical protein